ncbi:maleylpyruvate isomerase family mycothiol-dependent enzyme [Ornithinimicrobium avium]|uniref:Maleylpyruvate isomerase family mycothiol-dependent enzyme n=1 Tax=Ornithinimicrobium avium TaxID=2283195 RepID=A0A345NMS0_9MICO|nr:maleylpyruvate isomerase family mycothiol-dependent enzyme [Ornithinimicrobium avium]AXH96328.1 maleylpyruvate isomerase family mycothiol-dependent enzyme [Ornithinimicrobium avium]
MPVHPAAPADLTELVAAYRQTLTSFADVADGLREEDWSTPVLPGWTAREVLAHVVHVEDYLSGSEHPVQGWTQEAEEGAKVAVDHPEHVRNSFGVWIEEGVLARADRSPADLVEELRGLLEVRSAGMYDADLELDTPVRSVRGRQSTFEALTRMRIIDVWVHEQDLRGVVDRPGSLDSPGASQLLETLLGELPRIVLERLAPEPGTVLILESTGPVTARGGVRIGLDADDRLVAHELFTGHAGDAAEGEDAPNGAPQQAEPEEQATTVALSTFFLGRRAAGRVPTQETAYQVVGDEDLARRLLDALVITP